MRGLLDRDRAALPALLIAAVLALLWLAVAPPTPDLAAQVYRSALFGSEGYAIYDASWYGGHNLLGYSLVFPPIGALLGPRVVGALAVTASVACFSLLLRGRFSEPAIRVATIWFALAAIGDLMIGRITFSLGVAIGLAALLAWDRRRFPLAVIGAVACAATSPVAGLFMVLAAGSLFLANRSRPAALMAGGAGLMVLGLALGFPEGGEQPYPLLHTAIPVAAGVALFLVAGEDQRPVKIAAAIYVPAVIASALIPSPLGENVSRLAILFAGPLIAAIVLSRTERPRYAWALAVLAVAIVGWQALGPIRETAKGASDPSTAEAFHQPLIDWFATRGPEPFRVEVPFTRGHWEATYLAPNVPLARGWMTQLDTKYGELFYRYERPFSPAEYRRWLSDNAVRYVAVPDAAPDPSSRRELEVIASRPSWLKPVWSNADWKVYEFQDRRPLLSGPGRLTWMGRDGFALRTGSPKPMVVRMRWTSYFTVVSGSACLSRAAGGWTRVAALRPGTVRVGTRFAPGRAVSRGMRCVNGTS